MEQFKDLIINEHDNSPIYRQIYQGIKDLVRTGKLDVGYRLPAIRKLAEILEVNPSTIVKAYKILEEEGYIAKNLGSGCFISTPKKGAKSKRKHYTEKDFEENLLMMGQLEMSNQWINLASTSSSTDLFPIDDFKEAVRSVMERDGGEVFGYQESKGYYPLRTAIVEYLKEFDIDCSSEHIQIISGAQQGIDILAKSLLHPKDKVIVETPTYTGAISSFKSRGAEIIGIPNTSTGISLNELESCIKAQRPRLIYIMPNFHNPTGYCYDLETKLAILELAERYNLMIIEDDFASELYFEGDFLPTLKSLDKYNRVIYIKSFSKVFAPGLRLAFILYPVGLTEKIIAAKHISDISTSGLVQRSFEYYLASGRWKDHISKIKTTYKERCTIITSYIDANMLDQVSYYPPKGGISLWLTINKETGGNLIYRELKKKGVIILPGSAFHPDGEDISNFRISYTQVDKTQLASALEVINAVIKSVTSKESYEGIPLNPLV